VFTRVNTGTAPDQARPLLFLPVPGVARYPCYHGTLIRSFRDSGSEDIFNGRSTKSARGVCPEILWRVARRKLERLDSIVALEELRVPPGNRLENLSGDRDGRCSIRINSQYRICFIWTSSGPDEVEIVDYHR